ncbi:MAG: T6SS effector amidase Tae4 family protein [Pseudomonadota bacterium]
MDEGLRSKEELEKKQEGGRNRLKDMIDDREMQGETRNYLKEELDNQENQEEVRESLKKELDNPLFRDVSEAYQEKRKFAETLFASKEHFRARCAVVLSAALDLRPDPKLKEKSLADIDTNIIEPAFRGTEVLERFYVQAQQLADRLARDWHQMKRYDDWHTARAKLGGHKGVIFFRDADFRLSTLRLSGDHIDVWDGALTGSGYSFSRAKEIWFWELPN